MRKYLCILLTVAICIISGCTEFRDLFPAGDNTQPSAEELKGKHYAKLNSIGCLDSNDMETAKLANNRSDFETIDHLIREKRCFVIPTGTDIFINKRVKDDIVSAKFKGSTQVFYTVRSNLVAE